MPGGGPVTTSGRVVAVAPAGIAGIDKAVGRHLEVRQRGALDARREGEARHHRPAHGDGAVGGGADFADDDAALGCRAAPPPARTGRRRAGRRRRGGRRSGRSRRRPGCRPCRCVVSRHAGARARRRARARPPSTLLQAVTDGQRAGLRKLRDQRARQDHRIELDRALLSAKRRGSNGGAAPACRRPAATAAARSRGPRTTTSSAW